MKLFLNELDKSTVRSVGKFVLTKTLVGILGRPTEDIFYAFFCLSRIVHFKKVTKNSLIILLTYNQNFVLKKYFFKSIIYCSKKLNSHGQRHELLFYIYRATHNRATHNRTCTVLQYTNMHPLIWNEHFPTKKPRFPIYHFPNQFFVKWLFYTLPYPFSHHQVHYHWQSNSDKKKVTGMFQPLHTDTHMGMDMHLQHTYRGILYATENAFRIAFERGQLILSLSYIIFYSIIGARVSVCPFTLYNKFISQPTLFILFFFSFLLLSLLFYFYRTNGSDIKCTGSLCRQRQHHKFNVHNTIWP